MRYLLTCMFVCIAFIAFSQTLSLDSAEVKNSPVEFNGGKYSGYMIELNAPPDIVENAILERFKLLGIKPKETNNFLVYRNVIVPLVDAVKPMDAFIKIERKSRKEKEQTIVYFIVSSPGDIPEDKVKSGTATRTGEMATIEKSADLLTATLPGIKQGVFDKDLASQQSVVKKEEKKLAELLDDQSDMDKKLKKLQSDIEYNKKAQERQIAEVEKAKILLTQLTSKNPAHAQ